MIHIETQQFVIQQPSARTIHPDMKMADPDFLRGYVLGLKTILHPNESEPHTITDEDTIQAIKECLTDDPDSLPYVLGTYIGYIIGKCH
jgi:hypothetical protein